MAMRLIKKKRGHNMRSHLSFLQQGQRFWAKYVSMALFFLFLVSAAMAADDSIWLAGTKIKLGQQKSDIQGALEGTYKLGEELGGLLVYSKEGGRLLGQLGFERNQASYISKIWFGDAGAEVYEAADSLASLLTKLAAIEGGKCQIIIEPSNNAGYQTIRLKSGNRSISLLLVSNEKYVGINEDLGLPEFLKNKGYR